MLHRALTAMTLALACVLASPTHAHPNYPGLTELRPGKADRAEIRKTSDARKRILPRPAAKALVTPSRKAQGRVGRPADVVSIAERYLGTNPTTMRRLWCANFLGMIERKVGRAGTGSNMARSYADYGKAVRSPQRGDIAVLSRGKRGGHVGYFVGWAKNGRAILISGNSRGGVVAKGHYSTARVIAWRRPA